MNLWFTAIQFTLKTFQVLMRCESPDVADLWKSSVVSNGDKRAGNAGLFFGGRRVGGSAGPSTSQKCVHQWWEFWIQATRRSHPQQKFDLIFHQVEEKHSLQSDDYKNDRCLDISVNDWKEHGWSVFI